jgi:hypothetical protein
VLSENRRTIRGKTKCFVLRVRLGRLTMETWAEIGNITKTGAAGMTRMRFGCSVLEDNDDV